MKKIPIGLIKLFNVILVIMPFVYVWFFYYEPLSRTTNSKQVSVLMLTLYIAIFYYTSSGLDGFRVSIKRIGELVFGQLIAIGVTDVAATILIWMVSVHFPNLFPGLICFFVQSFVIIVCCWMSTKVFIKTHPPRKSVIIYDVRQGMEELVTAYGLERRFEVCESYAIEEVVDKSWNFEEQNNKFDQVLDGINDVFMCGIHTHERNVILKYCMYNNKRAFIIPRVGDAIMSSAERTHMFHLPFLKVVRYKPSMEYIVVKRVFDVLISGVAMILLLPTYLLVAILVRSDGGPALYKQTRLTKDGKQFKILKFRSMRVDAEKYSGAVWSAGENDPRITKVGRFIRACRLDEIPQLWNIFVGDMSIVGPRPERPELAAIFEKDVPEFALRLQCKAGLTGYAQVYGKYNTDPYDKLLMDLMYIANPTIFEDISIMLATIKILFSKESTEGVGSAEAELKYEVRRKK